MGKRTVGKANKGINVEKNNNRIKKIFLREKKKEMSQELRKSQQSADIS